MKTATPMESPKRICALFHILPLIFFLSISALILPKYWFWKAFYYPSCYDRPTSPSEANLLSLDLYFRLDHLFWVVLEIERYAFNLVLVQHTFSKTEFYLTPMPGSFPAVFKHTLAFILLNTNKKILRVFISVLHDISIEYNHIFEKSITLASFQFSI